MKGKTGSFFEDDAPSFPQKLVDDQKLSQYHHGTIKKSRREKEKEAQEAKMKEEESLMAKAYDEFLETFEGETVSSRADGPGFVKSSASGGGETSTSYPKPRGRGSINAKPFEQERSPSPQPAFKPRGLRVMDSFLEEIKREQAEREHRLNKSSRAQGRSVTALAAYESQSGSKDRGDPATSNLFVANLPPSVSESSLGQFCAKYGPVGSVKIMWPRTDTSGGPGSEMAQARKTTNSGLSGFVSFMKRKDAELALRELDGMDWNGYALRVGWSKAVPVGPRAQYTHRAGSRSPSPEREKDRDRGKERDRERDRTRSPPRGPRALARPRSRSRSRRRASRTRSPSEREERTELSPEEITFINIVAGQVREHGPEFEERLRQNEAGNSKYSFLSDNSSLGGRFYRSALKNTKPPPNAFADDGYDSVYSTDSEEESERERTSRDKLGWLARRRFEAMLRSLSGKRGEIARCMAFSLEHAEAASEVTDIIISSILVDDTPVPRKVARLHLLCDILHNSAASVPNAWKFRQEFQSRLGLVFDHLSTIYHSFPGRITAETFKSQIVAVVEVWEDSIVFPPDFTTELRHRLDGVTARVEVEESTDTIQEPTPKAEAPAPSKFKSKTFRPATEPDGVEDMEIEDDSEQENGRNDQDDDLDGAPLDEDVDGVPMDDDIDGIPIDNDLDGEPL